MANGPDQRRLFLPADWTEADLQLAEFAMLKWDLRSLWVAWLIDQGPATPPTLPRSE